MAIASSTDAGSELLLRSFPRAKRKVWQHFVFREDACNREIVDTKEVICRLGNRSLSYSRYITTSQSKKGTIFCCLYSYYRDNYHYCNRLDTNNHCTMASTIFKGTASAIFTIFP